LTTFQILVGGQPAEDLRPGERTLGCAL